MHRNTCTQSLFQRPHNYYIKRHHISIEFDPNDVVEGCRKMPPSSFNFDHAEEGIIHSADDDNKGHQVAELEEEINLENFISLQEYEHCIKGRLTALYKMAMVWRKIQATFGHGHGDDEIMDHLPGLSPPRFLKPCKVFWLRRPAENIKR